MSCHFALGQKKYSHDITILRLAVMVANFHWSPKVIADSLFGSNSQKNPSFVAKSASLKTIADWKHNAF